MAWGRRGINTEELAELELNFFPDFQPPTLNMLKLALFSSIFLLIWLQQLVNGQEE